VSYLKELTNIPNPPETQKALKKPGPKSGRKSSRTKGSTTPAGQGATRLRDSVNTMVGNQSDAIAKALIDKTLKGDTNSARIVVQLSGESNVVLEAPKKRGPQPWIKRVSTEPELPGPWDEQRKRDASRLPLSDFDLPEDLK
jgi:hypothetical protein